MYWRSVQFSHSVMSSSLWPQVTLTTSIGVGNNKTLQYSYLENSMDRRAWWATVRGLTKTQTRRSSWAHTQLVYSVLLISGVQQSDSVLCVCTHTYAHTHMCVHFAHTFAHTHVCALCVHTHIYKCSYSFSDSFSLWVITKYFMSFPVLWVGPYWLPVLYKAVCIR